jgi:hypothetical protein
MSGYTPQVGDRMRLSYWPQDSFITVKAVGGHMLLGVNEADVEEAYYLTSNWLKVPEPVVYPERWITIDNEEGIRVYPSRGVAEESLGMVGGILIYVAADGTVTSRTVERES